MTQFNWRAKWQPRTKIITLPDGTETGGFEVVDVRPCGGGYQFVTWRNNWFERWTCNTDGQVLGAVEESNHELDLLPVEQPATPVAYPVADFIKPVSLARKQPATRTDTEGRDVTGLIGLHDESDLIVQQLDTLGQINESCAAVKQQIASLTAERDGLREALHKIARWFGEFPPSGRFWDDERTQQMSYGQAFGSNGERDFMRQVARDALAVTAATKLTGCFLNESEAK